LEREALVTVVSGRRLIVSAPTLRDIDKVYRIRRIVELAASREISADDHALLRRLEDCVARDAAAVDSGDRGALMEANTAFHMTLISAHRNGRLQGFIDSIHDLVIRSRLLSMECADRGSQSAQSRAMRSGPRLVVSRSALFGDLRCRNEELLGEYRLKLIYIRKDVPYP
jgi:DNA-binding GntR family transcriptional regulator|tara:strand:+ start:357 stop:866 length:510 start_codon:yes stop_codon:yes gene_type:complete